MKKSQWIVVLLLIVASSIYGQNIQDLVRLFVQLQARHPVTVAEKYKHEYEVTHLIMQQTISDGAVCTATAIGPRALLTATHCENPTDDLEVDHHPLQIMKRLRDGNDHTIYIMANTFFPVTVNVDETELSEGDDVFIIGNPTGYRKILRKGTFSGIYYADEPAEDGQDHRELIYDLNIGVGDSGAAVFDSKGDVTGVISMMVSKDGFRLSQCFPLAFTQAQLDEAEGKLPKGFK